MCLCVLLMTDVNWSLKLSLHKADMCLIWHLSRCLSACVCLWCRDQYKKKNIFTTMNLLWATLTNSEEGYYNFLLRNLYPFQNIFSPKIQNSCEIQQMFSSFSEIYLKVLALSFLAHLSFYLTFFANFNVWL